jgi:hypothetical protein
MKIARLLSLSIGIGLAGACSLSAEDLFYPAETCGFCHSSGSGALVDEAGKDVSIWHDWSASMMANALRDPLFQAKIASEVERSPNLKSVIEDKCTRCHAPMARTQYYHDGGEHFGLDQTHDSTLAHDGVSCALCHQIQPDHLGNQASFSGHFIIEPKREIYGPYEEVFTMPMQHHLDFTPMLGQQISRSSLCGSCHVLFTPIVDLGGKTHGQFPEQTVYLEWLNSRYASEESRQDCQDCHLRKVDGPVKITRRPPWFDIAREPFKQHTFNGGNRLVLGMLKGMAGELEETVLEQELAEAIRRTETMLRDAASLEILRVGRDQALDFHVAVENRSGHKLPTGYPSRRVWLRVAVKDADGKTVFESGAWDSAGEIVGLDHPFEPHHEMIQESAQVQVYESVMGDLDGHTTHTLLRAAEYLKDNRLPPVGFRRDGPWAKYTDVFGNAKDDQDFNQRAEIEGTGQDIVHYRIPVQGARYPLRVEAELLYQTASPRFVKDLLRSETAEAKAFDARYADADKQPFRIASTSLEISSVPN